MAQGGPRKRQRLSEANSESSACNATALTLFWRFFHGSGSRATLSRLSSQDGVASAGVLESLDAADLEVPSDILAAVDLLRSQFPPDSKVQPRQGPTPTLQQQRTFRDIWSLLPSICLAAGTAISAAEPDLQLGERSHARRPRVRGAQVSRLSGEMLHNAEYCSVMSGPQTVKVVDECRQSGKLRMIKLPSSVDDYGYLLQEDYFACIDQAACSEQVMHMKSFHSACSLHEC